MKFIKDFKVFESTEFEKIKIELEDILQEMKDEFKSLSNNDLPIEIRYVERGGKDIISIRIGKVFANLDDYSLKMDKSKDSLFRINDYMESEVYRFKSFSWDYAGETKFSYTTFGPKVPFESILKIGETVYVALFYTKNTNI